MTASENLSDQLRRLRIEHGDKGPAPAPPRKRLVVLLAAALAVLGAAAVYRLLLAESLVVEVVRARASETATPLSGAVLSGSGYVVTGEKYISIGVRVPGRIERFLVEEGDHVEIGQPLVRLDDRDYRAQVGRAEAAIRLARANRDLARAQRARTRGLFQDGIASPEERDQAESRYEVSEASLAQAENELAQAHVNLEDTILRSPVRGVVLARLKSVGEIAVPGGFAGAGDLVRLADLSEVRAEVDINEADLASVRLGQEAEVTPDAYPQKRYRAKVVKLYPQVNRQKGTLKVEVRIEDPDPALLPDMSVRVTFLGGEPTPEKTAGPVILVPRGAIRKGSEGAYAWVVEDGKLRRASIRVGAELGDEVQVASGITDGQMLAVGSEEGFRDGARVTTRGR